MKKALILVNICKDESIFLAEEIHDFLATKNIDSVFYSFNGFSQNTPLEEFSFIVTLGGDGTVLYAARNCVKYGVPVFPVNLGQFGFIAAVQPDEWKERLEEFLDSKAEITQRSMMQVNVFRDEKLLHSFVGLNDVVISAKLAAKTISINVTYNSSQLCNLKSDGLIVASPTGSTAYSASAGGPILDPEMEAFVLTPINPFSLSGRPFVLNSKGKLEIILEKSRVKEAVLSVDGQEPVMLLAKDRIEVTQLEEKIKLVSCTPNKYYNALRSKLNWTGGPHA